MIPFQKVSRVSHQSSTEISHQMDPALSTSVAIQSSAPAHHQLEPSTAYHKQGPQIVSYVLTQINAIEAFNWS